MARQAGQTEFVPRSCKSDQSVRSSLARQGFRRNGTVYKGFDTAGNPLIEVPPAEVEIKVWQIFAITRRQQHD